MLWIFFFFNETRDDIIITGLQELGFERKTLVILWFLFKIIGMDTADTHEGAEIALQVEPYYIPEL